MGFWKATGKLAVEAAKDALSSEREVKETHDRLEGKSNAELRKITTDNGFFSSTTETEKRLARKVLRDRGER
ncbi:transposase [Citrobacter amalonaticus]|uniref:transposase n=1 Tax=Citrobacter amalonaticus TaxID=35703 RepID=UPI0022E8243D|nr:transposase [Citrobacter amalonaticus]